MGSSPNNQSRPMANNNPPVVALITDFGTQDWYCGTIQGKILSGCPDARIVNISHFIPAGDVYTASYVLASCMADFPANTLFLCVVDPGVGTSRKAIVGRIGPYTVIAPDNGLISHAVQKYAHDKGPFYEITPEVIPSGGISSTFTDAMCLRQWQRVWPVMPCASGNSVRL
jgi:S-adenosylmethionine hydrolase